MPDPTNDALDSFDSLAEDIATRLREFCGFAASTPPVPVLVEHESNLTDQVTLALAKPTGLVVIVCAPEFDLGEQPSIIRPQVTLQICQNAVQGSSSTGAGISALKAALTVYFALTQADWSPEGWSRLLPPEGGRPVRRVGAGPVKFSNNVEIANLLTYEVVLETWANFLFPPES